MNSKDKTAHYEPILRPTPLWTQIFNQSQASTDFKGDLPAWAPQSRARDFSDRGKTGPAGTEQSASGGEAETSTAYGQDRAAVSKQRAYDHLTLEQLYEDPAADPAALWIASRTVHALDRPDVLDPLIELLLDKMISEPLADIETKRMPGDFSRRPVKTMRPQNLADYETFEDLIDLPTGGTIQEKDGPAIEYFSCFAARHARALIIETLKTEAREGCCAAPTELRGFFDELTRREELDDFAATAIRDLAIAENFDEYSLVNDLGELPFSSNLLSRRPEQASRFAKDHARATRNLSMRRYQLKLPQAVDSILQSFSGHPSGSVISDIALLNEITGYVQNLEGLDDIDELGRFGAIRQLARDERLLALLSTRGRVLLMRNAARWLYEVESGEQDLGHALVRLRNNLTLSNHLSGLPATVTILQGETSSTFDPGNWPFFLAYALGPGDPCLDDKFEIVITRTQTINDAHGSLIFEISAGVLIEGNNDEYLTAEEFRKGHGCNLTPRVAGAVTKIVDAADFIYSGPAPL
jgi:hypothetical protein